MNMIRLSRKSIGLLVPAKHSTCYWDQSFPEFGVEVHPDGRKNFVMRFEEGDQLVKKAIAPCHLLEIKTARQSVRNFLTGKIVLPGCQNNLASKPSATPESRATIPDAAKSVQVSTIADTDHHLDFEDFCRLYMERHAKLHKASWKLDETRIKKYLLPAFAKLELSEISRALVAKLHQEIGSQYPYQANRVREQLSTMIELAKVWEILPENHPNPTRGIKDFEERHRKRWLKKAEVAKLIQALEREPCLYIRALFVLYLLTGARKNELMKIRWRQVDLQNGFIRIEHTKNRQIHELPLSTAALLLLSQIPRVSENEFVFPGKRKGRSYTNIDKPWQRIRKRAGLEDVHIHDLRHTVGAWLAQDGNSLLLIGKVLNHQSDDATRIYAHLTDDSVKSALEKHGKQIMPLLSQLFVNERQSKYCCLQRIS